MAIRREREIRRGVLAEQCQRSGVRAVGHGQRATGVAGVGRIGERRAAVDQRIVAAVQEESAFDRAGVDDDVGERAGDRDGLAIATPDRAPL